MFGIAAVPAVTQLIGFLFLPESPRWLTRHGNHQKALLILSRLHGPQQAEIEYERIKINEDEQRIIERERKGIGIRETN